MLLADDDRSLCISLRDVLGLRDHRVEIVHSGAEALAACRGRPFDLLLLDVTLPDASGVELIEQIEALQPELDILVITGHATLDTAVHAVSRSTIGYMLKPLDLDRLLGILDGIARRRSVARENERLLEDLRQARDRWEATFDAISVPIAVFGADGGVIRVNAEFRNRFATGARAIVGAPLADLLFGQSSERGRELLDAEIGSRWERDDLVVPGVFELVRHPLDLERSPGGILVVRDVTEQRAAARERERLIAELEAKNAELERYAYTVSHDLKSPLITITGFLGLVQRAAAAGDAEGVGAAIARIETAAHQMKRMLDELLELSRVGRFVGPAEAVQLERVVRDAVEQARAIDKSRAVRFVVAAGLPRIQGDPVRLHEVFQNLLDNAVRFMGEQPDPSVEIGVRHDDGERVFYVADNGIGIEPRYHKKVFGLFDRLDQNGSGTGIGLALVKRIVEFHGGRIWVESDGNGRGSTFCFTLPEAGRPAAVAS